MAILPPRLEIDEETVVCYDETPPQARGTGFLDYPCRLEKVRRGVKLSKPVAVKCISARDGTEKAVAMNEVKIWRLLPEHPNVLKLLESLVVESAADSDAFKCYLITDRMRTDLNNLIFEDDAFAASVRYSSLVNILIQACRAIKHLHDNEIIHLGVRPWSFAVHPQETLFLKNFGLSIASVGSGDDVPWLKRIMIGYSAPELHTAPCRGESTRFSKAMDIYSLGVLMWEILNRTRLHGAPQALDHHGRSINWPSQIKSKNVWCGGPDILCSLVESCLQYNGTMFNTSDHGRPTIDSILETLEALHVEDWWDHPVPSYHQDEFDAANKVPRSIDAMDKIKPFVLHLDNGAEVEYRGEAKIGSTINTVVLPGTILLHGDYKEVAIKYAWTEDRERAAQLKSEIDIMAALPEHENVVHLYGGKMFPPSQPGQSHKVFVVTKLMKSNLEEHVLKDPEFRSKCTMRDLLQIFISLCDGLQFLHGNNVIHHDMKLQNVLVSANGVMKIADFGLSKNLIEDQSSVTASFRGTRPYMAPEILGAAQYRDSYFRASFAVDVYSLGVMFWECLNLFKLSNFTNEVQEVRQGIVWHTIHEKKTLPCGGPPCLAQLIEDCLRFEDFNAPSGQGRPTAQELSERLHLMLNEEWAESMLLECHEELRVNLCGQNEDTHS